MRHTRACSPSHDHLWQSPAAQGKTAATSGRSKGARYGQQTAVPSRNDLPEWVVDGTEATVVRASKLEGTNIKSGTLKVTDQEVQLVDDLGYPIYTFNTRGRTLHDNTVMFNTGGDLSVRTNYRVAPPRSRAVTHAKNQRDLEQTETRLTNAANKIATIAKQRAHGWGSEMAAQAAEITSAANEYERLQAKG